LEPVYGASCSESLTCVGTKYTLATCDIATKNCSCYTGYVPIHSGCGRQLQKPVINSSAPYSNEILPGKEAVLTCSSNDGATLFEWTKDGMIEKGSSASRYTIKADSIKESASFRCKAKASNDDFDSPQSEPLSMNLINVTPQPPVVQVYPTHLFAGKNANLTCRNLPNGYDLSKISFLDEDLNEIISPLKMDLALSEKPVTCRIKDQSLKKDLTSLPIKLPKVVVEISEVRITPALNNEEFSINEEIVLKCLTNPESEYVDTPAQITYTWLINLKAASDETAQTYSLPRNEGNFIVTCEASYKGKQIQSSGVSIIRNSTYLTKPTIKAKPETLVLGSQLILACDGNNLNLEYSWQKETMAIPSQFDNILQLNNLTLSDAGDYICSVTRGKVTLFSDVFTISFK
ncbi:GPI-anchored protein PB15E9.01c, partial [Biomphalaria glabrata]